ncbi:hypothetical protein [Parasitella parasitica]|uniref:Uncharacterized protein n=1 Tax=Parasitella parasitica TaxID=35722 RepID=A0A0B7MVC1_9FUNG|nr:hypothetical protein [Parasitella parasitica]
MEKQQLNKSSFNSAKFPELEELLINFVEDMESRETATGSVSIITKANQLILDNPKLIRGKELAMSNG